MAQLQESVLLIAECRQLESNILAALKVNKTSKQDLSALFQNYLRKVKKLAESRVNWSRYLFANIPDYYFQIGSVKKHNQSEAILPPLFLNTLSESEKIRDPYYATVNDINCFASHIKEDVLCAHSYESALFRIERWLLVMRFCYLTKDYHSCIAINGAVNSPELTSLFTWNSGKDYADLNLLDPSSMKLVNEINGIIRSRYNKMLQDLQKSPATQKCHNSPVPFLGAFKTWMVFTLEQGVTAQEKLQDANKLLSEITNIKKQLPAMIDRCEFTFWHMINYAQEAYSNEIYQDALELKYTKLMKTRATHSWVNHLHKLHQQLEKSFNKSSNPSNFFQTAEQVQPDIESLNDSPNLH